MRLASVRFLAVAGLLAVTLLAPAGRTLAVGTLDQSQLTQVIAGGTITPGFQSGQSFTAGLTGALDQVNVAVVEVGGAPSGNFTVQVRTVDAGGLPTGTVLGTVTVPMSSLPVQSFPADLSTFTLAPPAPVVAGAQYALVFFGDSPYSTPVGMPGSYGGGKALFNDSGWFASSDTVRSFQTFVTQATISVAAGSISEGGSGTSSLVFPVVLSLAIGADATVPYTLASGTAVGGSACTPGVDFVNTGGVATITTGSVQGTIVVPICGDAEFEPDESLTVALGEPAHALPGTMQGIGTIQNDDLAPTVTPTSTPTPTPTPTPTSTVAPVPTATLRPAAAQDSVRVSVRRAGNGRLLVTLEAREPIRKISWSPQPAVAVETEGGQPFQGGELVPPDGSLTVTFYVRRLSGASATLPLSVTGDFGTWQTFVGGGPNAW